MLRTITALTVVTLALGSTVSRPAAQRPSPDSVLITGATLIDGTGASPRAAQDVLVVGGRIASVGPDAAPRAPSEARRIDAKGKWIIPGLIDGHVHFFQTGGL